MDTINVAVLVLAAVVLVFGERIKGTAIRLSYKLKAMRSANRLEWIATKLNTIHQELGHRAENRRAFAGELNHIKGQLQEAIHKLQDNQTQVGTGQLTVFEAVNDLRRAVEAKPTQPTGYEDILYVKAGFEELNKRLSQGGEDINSVYLQSLATLTRSSNTLLERQEKIEGLLVQLLGQLNRLTNS